VLVVRGSVAVTQAQHAAMCGELAAAWGNESFGDVDPVVRLAAEQHELGWAELDASPPLDPATGAPLTVGDLHFSRYLHTQLDGPRRLAARDPYAGLLASLHHVSLYGPPGALGGRLTPNGRRLRSFFARSVELQGELRRALGVPEARVAREWRLVRAWDGLSHDLLLDRAPCERPRVPDADGTLLSLRLDRAGEAVTVDPWPFRTPSVDIPVRGRRLDEGRWRADAPEIALVYALRARSPATTRVP
jgi:hypothetical protein